MIDLDYGWGTPPANVILSQDSVHIWYTSLDQSISKIQSLAQTLTIDERLRAESFYFEQDRLRFIVGRGLLRTILGYYLDIEPDQLQFCYNSQGKPSLAETFGGGRIRFNLTHSHGFALYAVTVDREVGIDLEFIRPIAEAEQIANRFFSDREQAIIRELSGYEKHEAFFTYWTCKEAYLKACGAGLALLSEKIEISLISKGPTGLLSIDGDIRKALRWSLHLLNPDPDFAAAVVVEGHNHILDCWRWSK